MIIVRGEAGHRPDCAVDVERGAAGSTDQVMMIVSHSVLEPGRGSGWLDPADEVLVDQDAERVVYGLAGDRPDHRPDFVGQLVGRGVGARRHRPHDGQPLGGHLHAVLAQ